MPNPFRRIAAVLAFAMVPMLDLILAGPLAAHPVPYSYVDLTIADGGISGRVTVHDTDAAAMLGLPDPDILRDEAEARRHFALLAAHLQSGLHLPGAARIEWQSIAPATHDEALVLQFRLPGPPPAALPYRAHLIRADPLHQTFVNVHEAGELRQQAIFAATTAPAIYYRGTTAGAWEVMRVFVPSGVQHILIGPDHLLFLFGLLLLGGTWRQLVKIVTAFTLGHSVTLSLAALDIVNVPASWVEPAIALTIVVVGADNLLRGNGKDLRPGVALLFGLVHGFGFASVLREFGLPQEALGWSLFSFNVGVELGQLAVVLLVAGSLALIRHRWPRGDRAIVVLGSVGVIAAGLFWFAERTIGLPGGN